jgi:hypothetical protein
MIRLNSAPASARGMPRRVDPEWLDFMPASDPRAIRSRQDLRRVNRLLGSLRTLLSAIDPLVVPGQPLHLIELGAGDGSLMLQLAQQRRTQWGDVRLTLLDRHPLVSLRTLAALRACGWQVEVVEADVFRWLTQPTLPASAIVLSNLFVHHFEGVALNRLLAGIAGKAQAFVCCEPRRSVFALTGSYLLGAIGCNAVTRHDAVLSVHAGFRDDELSARWPQVSDTGEIWQLSELPAGLFSHCFIARRGAR